MNGMVHTLEGLDESQRLEYEIAGGQMLFASPKDLARWAVVGEQN
jgi:hypothetical protein